MESSLQHTALVALVACEILASRAEIEPASPVLIGGFLTTGPPGKSVPVSQNNKCLCVFCKQIKHRHTTLRKYLKPLDRTFSSGYMYILPQLKCFFKKTA